MQTRPPSDPALARTGRRLADRHASFDTVLVALASCFSWCSERVLLNRLDDAARTPGGQRVVALPLPARGGRRRPPGPGRRRRGAGAAARRLLGWLPLGPCRP